MSEAGATEPQRAALALPDKLFSRLVLVGAGAADIIALLVAAEGSSIDEPPSTILVRLALLLMALNLATWLARRVIVGRYRRDGKLNAIQTAIAVYKIAILTAVLAPAVATVVTLPFGTDVAGLFVRALTLLMVFYALTTFLTGVILNLNGILV